jgi:hypothetical protein
MRHRSTLPKGPGLHPVLCFLHGYDEAASASGDEGFTTPRPARAWRHRYADEVGALVEQHGGDPQRRYLTGFSFGGNGVFDLALLQPRLGDDKRAGIDQGDDHVGAARRAYADETIYSWLLRWSISSSRRSP